MRNVTNTPGVKNFQANKPSMHKAVCDECGVNCEVPFKPSGDKPIFCSNCFQDKRPDSSHRGDRSNRRDDSRRPSFGDKEMHSATCDECGSRCEVPFKPTSGKPVFCSTCFGKSDGRRDGRRDGGRDNRGERRGNDRGNGGMSKSSENLNNKFEMLNAKVDKIMEALKISVPVKVQFEKPKTENKNEQIKSVVAKIDTKKSVSKVVKGTTKASKPKKVTKTVAKKKPAGKKKK